MANPTTNYGWPMPTSTDLVTDLPADFAAFGQPVDTSLKALNPETTLGDLAYRSATANTNTRLPIGTNGQVLGVVAGVPAWTTDASGMTNPMTTTGDTIYSSSGSTPARLGIGTTGQVLSVSGGVPAWATVASSPIKQIVNAQNSGTSTSNATSTYADVTGLTATITPSSASSKIYAIVTIHGSKLRNSSTTNMYGYFNLVRGATQLTELPIGLVAMATFGTNAEDLKPVAISWYDSPATTSATTYKVQLKASAGTIYANNDASLTLMEI